MNADRPEKRVSPDLEAALRTAHKLSLDFQRRPDFIQHIQDVHIRSGRTLQDPMDRTKYWRHAADFLGRENYRQPLSFDQLLAQLRVSTPDLVFSMESLNSLRNDPQQATILGYTMRRIARFQTLLHEAAEMQPDLPVSVLAAELRGAFQKTGITDPARLIRAQSIINKQLLNIAAERGLQAQLETVSELEVARGTFTDRVNGVALWAQVPVGNVRHDGTRALVTAGIGVHHSIDDLNEIRRDLGRAYDMADPFLITADEDGFARVEAHAMLTREEYAGRFDPLPWVVEQRGPEAAHRLMQAVDAANLDYLAH